ncbi:MAG: hypothetical protein BroJett040_15490 [Oligoflexia bacterium]|nr:MAG: hypothetical protein BroJett040_15490 [Oligoflexia bacterium]
MKSVGIDIGSSSIKVVEINQSNKGLILSRFHEQVIAQNPAFDPEIEILEYLRNLATQYDPQTTKIVVGLKQEQVSCRNKIFPFSDRMKILKSLPFELEEDIPLSPEATIYDAKIIKTMGNSAEVLACAALKSRIGQALRKFEDAGLEVSLLSSEGLAFANCWEKWNSEPPAAPTAQIELENEARPRRDIHIVLHIGHTHTLVTAFEDQSLIGIRTILWGGKNIVEAIVKKYEIPYVEAMKELQQKGFILATKEGASYDQIVFSDTISGSFRDFAREVRISLLEFQSEFNGYVTSVGLTGGPSHILNLNAFLTQMLEVPVNPLHILSSFSHVQFDQSPHVDSVCGVALGLAIEGLKKPRNPAINFLKGEFAKKNTRLIQFWDDWGKIIQTAAAAFVIFLIYSIVRVQVATSMADKSQETLKTQAKAIAKLPAKQATEAGVKKYIREQKKKAGEFKALTSLSQMNSALDVVKKISDAAPAKSSTSINVRKLIVSEGQVEIEGSVSKAQDLTLLQSALSQISLTGKITPAKAGQTPALPVGAVPFAYSFPVDRNLGSSGPNGTTK